MHVVIAQKDHMPASLGPSDKMHPFLNQSLSGLVSRVGLAGQNQLHWVLGIG